ncbi:hypothetical protein LRP67_08695 [Nocardioides sp. cx-169]|uniref:hypothetical protein n=1 Tax=Nocardioides sp. cx-169 TaxID=2899080 RepID=UPI001E47A1EE|nr:hypothetical protein [Nocardioides sp. cx-169]MCD4534156.1 hypothetical protein [Nocardioides sp. cx-169]
MAWEDDLFEVLDDLEQRAAALYDAERAPELADRSRAEYQQVTLAARLVASVDREVALEVRGVGTVAGVLRRVAAGWCLVRGASQDWLVPLPAVTAVSGASERAVPEVAWSPLSRLSLASPLRRLAESGERCVLHAVDGRRHEGAVARVGHDFTEVVEPSGRVVLVSFAALAAVQSP